jgi:3-oxoacyl-[acyl-carrier protein] reductase
MKLKGKVAIVVGGANGIGKRTSKLFSREGAKVMIADFDIKSANKVADEIETSGGEVITMKVDHTIEEECNEMVRATLGKFGQIDILANVAGIWPLKEGKVIDEGRWRWHPSRQTGGSFAMSTKEEWDKTIDINLNGPRNCTRAVINHMIERRSGKIVNFSSFAATQGTSADAYVAAKGGIIVFTRGLARELEPYGIQVNCVTPSGTLTERALSEFQRWQQAGQEVDTSKYCTPEEVAEAVLFLVSDASNHMSGQNIIFGTPTSP